MGNAMKFLEEMELREAERKKELIKKIETSKKIDERKKNHEVKVKVVKRCECCEKNFTDTIKEYCGRKYTPRFCESCRPPSKAKFRERVKRAGGWSEYVKIESMMLKYNDKSLKQLNMDELVKQRGYRIQLGVSYTDIDRILKKMYEDGEAK
jgi:hypothetical protein